MPGASHCSSSMPPRDLQRVLAQLALGLHAQLVAAVATRRRVPAVRSSGGWRAGDSGVPDGVTSPRSKVAPKTKRLPSGTSTPVVSMCARPPSAVPRRRTCRAARRETDPRRRAWRARCRADRRCARVRRRRRRRDAIVAILRQRERAVDDAPGAELALERQQAADALHHGARPRRGRALHPRRGARRRAHRRLPGRGRAALAPPPLPRIPGEDERRARRSPPQLRRPLGSANTAAAFLSQFVGDVQRWAHLDIAGVANVKAERAACSGATGFGVATLVSWLRGLAG